MQERRSEEKGGVREGKGGGRVNEEDEGESGREGGSEREMGDE